MNVKCKNKETLNFNGSHTETKPDDGYRKCSDFWDLGNVYPAPDSPEYTADLKKLSEILNGIRESIIDGSTELSELIDAWNMACDLHETMGAYTECLVSANTTDSVSVAALNRLEAMASNYASAGTLFRTYVAEHPKEVYAYVTEHPDYSFVLHEAAEEAGHQMSREMEELAADLCRDGADSFSRLQAAVSSAACSTLSGEEKTVIQLRALATNADRMIRQKAYEAELSVWKEHEIAFATALNGVKGTVLTLEKRRNWKSPIARSAAESRITEKTLDALISTLEKNLPLFRNYLKTKAKLLGLEKLAFYDLFAPVGNADMEYTLEEAREFVVRQYSTFDPAMGEFAKNAFENRWIDPYPRKNKTGGAYDTYLPLVKESRVFANFDGTYDGVATFAHELGHAWHDHAVCNKPAMLRTYPMTLAETASIFSEYIVFQGAVRSADAEQKKALIEMFLQNACQVCVDILCRFYFEREVFERRKDRELMPEELCGIMLECQKKTYGDGLDEKLLHPYMWAVKSHYYSADFSFYNYPYAFGQLFALGLYSRSQDVSDGKPFCETYKELLQKTGQLPAEEVAASAGIDIEDQAFWQQGIDIIASYEKQLEEFVS